MNETKVEEFLFQFLKEKMNIPAERNQIKPETMLGVGGLQMESLAIVELAVNLEAEFGIVVPDEDLDRISRFKVAELTGYLSSKQVTA
jgi:acyl carrier protein